METQSDSIDVTSIKSAALRAFNPPEAANFTPDVSSNDRLRAIQHAFQLSVAAGTTSLSSSSSSQHIRYQAGQTGSQPVQHPLQQKTLSELASTVPETQALIDVGNPLAPSNYAVSANIEPPPKSMSTQGSLPQDTQPVSQSIYESILNKAKTAQQLGQGADGANDAARFENEQASLQQGDEGHVDLLSSYQAQVSQLGDDSDSEPVNLSPTQNQQHYLSQFPESQRFKTPGTTSRKRNFNGEMIETPSLPRNPLARSRGPTPGKMMGLSQAFAATQAVSSPVVNGPLSGPMSDRPSPNIELQTRPATATVSSPLRPKSDLRRTATGPYSHYKSIKQSQAEREGLSSFGLPERIVGSDNASSDEFDDEPSLVERTRRLKEREYKVWQQLQAVSSANRLRSGGNADALSSPTNRALTSSPRTSPQSHRRRAGYVQDRFLNAALPEEPDNEVTDPDHGSEEETEKEEEVVEIARSSQSRLRDEEDKENLEFGGIEVPETVVRFQGAVNGYRGLESSPSDRQSASFDWRKDGRAERDGLEAFAVANSQPSQPMQKPTHPPRTQLTSSEDGPSFVPQSQVLADGTHISSSPQRRELRQSSANFAVSGLAGERQEREMVVGRSSSGHEQLPLPDLGQLDQNAGRDVPVAKGPRNSVQSRQQKSSGARIAETTGDGSRLASGDAPMTETAVAEISFLSPRESEAASSAPRLDVSKPTSSLSGEVPRSSAEFETAPTHLSNTAKNLLPSLPRKPSFVKNSPSGRKRQRMVDITQGPSPRRSNCEIDVDVAMEAVVDTEFQLDTSSPISPRRRIMRRRLQERQVGAVVDKAMPAAPNSLERVSPSPNEPQATALEEVSPPDRVDVDSMESAPSSPQSLPRRLNSTGLTNPLATPIEKPFFKRATTRSSRARHDLFDIQLSPEKTGPAKPHRLAAKLRGPPFTTPNRKARALIAVNGATSATQIDGQLRRRSRGSAPTPSESSEPLAIDGSKDNSLSAGLPPDDVVAPNQVLACFNGKTRAYYPATCLGITGSDSLRYQIQWEGFDMDETDASGVRKLDLRIGDSVKVNLDGFPRVSHIIRGFKNKVLPAGKGGPMTDVRGYSILLVAPKQRKSLPATVSAETVTEVPVSAIYLDSNMWSQMKGREYKYIPQQPVPALGFATPPERPSTPATPSSRSRRNPAASTNTTLADAVGMFTGMAFAISYDEARKSSLTLLIRQNGGIVLQDGFHEIFSNDRITPKPGYVHLGFTALLADRHSRKEKYMQALALNLPCLSGRWIDSCIAHGRVTDWQSYLLPAGESALLDGAIRSRILPPIPSPSVAKMVEMTDTRPRLLSDSAVIFVTGRGKLEEKRKPFLFLTQAMGAARIEKVVDLKAAKTVLDGVDSHSEGYKWVFVDDAQVPMAETLLNGGHGGTANQFRVVGNEYICQSLILGGLVEK